MSADHSWTRGRYSRLHPRSVALVASPLSVSAQGSDEGGAPRSAAAEPAVETQRYESWLERMHPEAFEAPAKKRCESGFELEYVPVWQKPDAEERPPRRLSRGGRIAIGVIIPVAAVGIGLGVGAAVAMSNWEW